MFRILITACIILSLAWANFVMAQDYIVDEDFTFGGTGYDALYSILETSQGTPGYLLVGQSKSNQSGDKDHNLLPGSSADIWVIKIDKLGNILWQNSYGGDGEESRPYVVEVAGGYVIFCSSSSSKQVPNKNATNKGLADYWLFRINAAGVKDWDESYGSDQNDVSASLTVLSDGNFLLFGSSSEHLGHTSGDRLTNPGKGGFDWWAVKVNSSDRKVIWEKAFGGSGRDKGFSALESYNNDILFVGNSRSGIVPGHKSALNAGRADWWLVYTDANGDILWEKTYGTPDGESAFTAVQLGAANSNNFVIAGASQSGIVAGVKTHAALGVRDFWMMEVDNTNGSKIWDNTYGGIDDDRLFKLFRTTDGGFLLGGFSESGVDGFKESRNYGIHDYWIVKTDGAGNKLWDQSFGSNNRDAMRDMVFDGTDLILAGESYSDIGDHKTQANVGSADYWIVKLKNCSIAGDCGSIEGTVVLDNGIACTLELPLPDIPVAGRMIKAENTTTGFTYYGFTDANGAYKINVDLGETFEVSIITGPGTIPVAGCTTLYTVTPNPLSDHNDFFLVGTCEAGVTCDLSNVTGWRGTVCECDTLRICITYANNGTQVLDAASGTFLQLDLSPHVAWIPGLPTTPACFLNSTPSAMSYTVDTKGPSTNPDCADPANSTTNFGDRITWDLVDNMAPGEVCSLCVLVIVEPGITAPNLVSKVTFKSECDGNFLTESDQCSDKVSCPSIPPPPEDPNDKRVTPEGCGPFGNIPINTEYLTYKVRFQNIGEGPAINVVIRDVIDSDLDIETIEFLSSSHAYSNVKIQPGNELVYTFTNIVLPGILVDEDGSQGFVKFRIRIKDGTAEGTEIVNSATIYFDEVEPVTTNSTVSTLRAIPEPIAGFTFSRVCDQLSSTYDFTYTGGTADGATYLWDFGPNASPSTSTEQHPSNITFGGSDDDGSSKDKSSKDDDSRSKDKGSKDDDSRSKDKGSKDDDSRSKDKGSRDDDSSSKDKGSRDDDSSSKGHRDDDSSSKGSKDDDSSGKGKGSADTQDQLVTLTIVRYGCEDVIAQTIEVPEVEKGKKVVLCHKGHLIKVGKKSLQKHLAHGDCVGPCNKGSSKTSEFLEPPKLGDKLIIYPNPFHSTTLIDFSVEISGEVVVDLFDITGNRVARLYSGYTESGKQYSTVLNGGDLRSGLYLIQVVSENTRMYDKVVILK